MLIIIKKKPVNHEKVEEGKRTLLESQKLEEVKH